MFKQFKSSRLFKKYLLAYGLAFLLPLIFISGFTYISSYTNLQKQLMEQNMFSHRAVNNTVKQAFEPIHNLVTVINKLSYISLANTPITFDNSYGIYKEIQNFNTATPLVTSTLLIKNGSDYIITSQGVSKTSVAMKNIYGSEQNSADFLSLLEGTTSPFFFIYDTTFEYKTNSTKRSMLIYVYPLLNGQNEDPLLMVFNLNPLRIQELLDYDSEHYTAAHLFSKSGDLLASSSASAESIPPNIMEQITEGTAQFDNHFISYSKCDSLNAYIATCTDLSFTFDSFIDSNQGFIYTLMLLFAVGAILAVFISIKLYFPIFQLAESANIELSKTDDELSTLNIHLNDLENSRREMLAELSSQMPYLENQIVSKLICGEYLQNDHDLFITQIFRKKLQYKHYMVITWTTIEANFKLQQAGDDFSSILIKILKDRGFAYQMYQDFYNAYVAVIFLHNPLGAEEQSVFLEQLTADLNTLADSIIGCGNIYSTLEGIHLSYLEAISSIQYEQMKNVIDTNRDPSPSRTKLHNVYQLDNLYELQHAIKVQDLDTCHHIIRNAADILETSNISYHMSRMICNEIILVLTNIIQEIDPSLGDSHLYSLIHYKNVTDFEEKFLAIAERLCSNAGELKKKKQSESALQIVSYIKNNYFDEDLCLTMLAEHFNLSKSYVSKIIIENTGYSFTKLLTNIRLNVAKDLLVSTDFSITDIAQQAGYSNLSNFMRRFKTLEGMTPGKYRELYKS